MTTKKRDDVAYAVRWQHRWPSGHLSDVSTREGAHECARRSGGTVVRVTRRKAVKLSEEARNILRCRLADQAHKLRVFSPKNSQDVAQCIAWLEEMRRRLEE